LFDKTLKSNNYRPFIQFVRRNFLIAQAHPSPLTSLISDLIVFQAASARPAVNPQTLGIIACTSSPSNGCRFESAVILV
jgi:hypothetical protein